jgi:hypothetical protein
MFVAVLFIKAKGVEWGTSGIPATQDQPRQIQETTENKRDWGCDSSGKALA